MRILVSGASGLLGLNLCLAGSAAHEMIGVDRNRLAGVPFDLHRLDLLEPGTAERLLAQVKPDALIHCAALASLEGCEQDPQAGQRLNADLPAELAGVCLRQGVHILHLSTDSVFDGTKAGIYTEDDVPNPQGVYSRTKLEGEQRVLAENPQACVARVNFFGWSLSGRRSLAEFFVNNLRDGKAMNGFQDVTFCPLFVGDLADTLLEMLAKRLSGLYHTVGSQAVSKYEFGRAIAHQFGWQADLIRPISVEESGLTAKRSHNLNLSVHKLSTALGHAIPAYSTGIERFYAQFQQGYPQKLASYQQVPG